MGVTVAVMVGVCVKSGVGVLLGEGVVVGVAVLSKSVSSFAGEKNAQAAEKLRKIISSSRAARAFRLGFIFFIWSPRPHSPQRTGVMRVIQWGQAW